MTSRIVAAVSLLGAALALVMAGRLVVASAEDRPLGPPVLVTVTAGPNPTPLPSEPDPTAVRTVPPPPAHDVHGEDHAED